MNNKRARKYIKNKSKLEIFKIIFEISDGQMVYRKSHEKLNENCVMLSIEDNLSQYGIDNQTKSLYKIDGILKKEDFFRSCHFLPDIVELATILHLDREVRKKYLKSKKPSKERRIFKHPSSSFHFLPDIVQLTTILHLDREVKKNVQNQKTLYEIS